VTISSTAYIDKIMTLNGLQKILAVVSLFEKLLINKRNWQYKNMFNSLTTFCVESWRSMRNLALREKYICECDGFDSPCREDSIIEKWVLWVESRFVWKKNYKFVRSEVSVELMYLVFWQWWPLQRENGRNPLRSRIYLQRTFDMGL